MFEWDAGLYLFTPEELSRLPPDTLVENISGSTCLVKDAKHKDKLLTRHQQEDDRSSPTVKYTMYGVRDPGNHELKELFLVFLLAT
jgi:hypothetical protein